MFFLTLIAYIEPGTSSYIFQILIAGVVSGLFGIKLFWNKIIGFFRRFLKRKQLESE